MKISIKKIKTFIIKHKYLFVCIIICLLIIGISRLVSYAFFTANDTKTLISGRVGDVTSPDFNIKLLIENRDSNGVGNGTYAINYIIPTSGYTYNSSISSCDNGTLTYDNSTNSFLVTATGRTICNIYYDAETINYSNDVTLVLMKEKKSPSCKGNCGYEEVTDLSVMGLINSGYMYNSDLSNCTGTSTITFNQTTNEINTVYNGQDTCTAYFKVSDAPIIRNVVLNGLTATSADISLAMVTMAPKAESYYYSTDGTNYTEVSSNIFTINSLTLGTVYTLSFKAKSEDNIESLIKTIQVITPFAYSGSENTITIPESGTYIIEMAGAEGSQGNKYSYPSSTYYGGKGAKLTAEFALNEGDILHVIVGGKGSTTNGTSSDGASGAGGGGSFVFKEIANKTLSTYQFTKGTTNYEVLLVAAGGGGTGDLSYSSTYTYAGYNGVGATFYSPSNFTAYSTTTCNPSSSTSCGGVLGISQYITYNLSGGYYTRSSSICTGGYGGGGCQDDQRSYGGGWSGSSYTTNSFSSGSETIGLTGFQSSNGYVIISRKD